jgi:hypothetical protein
VLHDPSELFGLKPETMLERDARLEPAADQIVNELLGRSGAASGSHHRDAARERIHRLCCREPASGAPTVLRARLTLVQRETQVAWWQGLRSLGRRRPFTA